MAKGAIINTIGRDLEKYRKDKIKQVKESVSFYGSDLQRRAQRGLDDAVSEFMSQGIDIRHIRLAIKVEKGGLKFILGVDGYLDEDKEIPLDEPKRIAVYIEFGTGLSAKDILSNYPVFIKNIASAYWVTGEGTLVGKPYLFNNYLTVWAEFQKELDKIMKSK